MSDVTERVTLALPTLYSGIKADGDEMGERGQQGDWLGRLCSDQAERCHVTSEGGSVDGKRRAALKRAIGNRSDSP